MTHRFVGCLSALLLVTSSGAACASSPPSTDVKLAQVLTHGESRPLAAIVAMRIHNGAVSYRYVGGFARKGGSDVTPARPDTLFRIASVSKFVTAIGLMQLVDQGKVDLDADASRYLGFRLRNPDFPDVPITPRMLLSHTASIADADDYVIPADHIVSEFFNPSRRRGMATYHFLPGRKPGAWFSYCNLCYGLVGTMVERVSGERFDLYQQKHVLTPLGIDGGYDPALLSHPERLATLYQHTTHGYEAAKDNNTHFVPEAPAHYRIGTNATIFSPQGGLRISLDGLYRLSQFVFGGGTVDNVTVLSSQSLRTMLQPAWRYDEHNGEGTYPIASYGLATIHLTGTSDPSGHLTMPWHGYRGGLVGHLGDAYGLRSGFWLDPETRDGYLFIVDGFPEDGREKPGEYSSFTNVEEKIFSALSGSDAISGTTK
ncbi:beta-lactamase [Gluconobacter thailandicus]|uniref:serine hydrolase domain-containing protein n=1 Tax=Gluconobacter thailandicus TaxID=257438 RepID=UPI000778046B|nr:serine hydrolase [Gluconobacter thailandicus]KXV35263.1 beta-lactamase [Gluconobacter thailandicus]